jgi:signal transduction histidine kinase/BarA-like signal transduction histidine kinase
MERGKRIDLVDLWDLPASSEHESGLSRSAPAASHPPGAGDAAKLLRVLLVEDSEDDAVLVLRQLTRGGYAPTCERVTTRAAFKATLESSAWDVIVSDHSIPGYGGLLALADLQASGKDIPFVLVSGTIGEAVAVEAMKAGAQDYVLKQDLTRLPVAIGRELREKAMREDQARMRQQLVISERMASAGMLAAGLAHEINNPLAVASANLEFMADKVGPLLAEARTHVAALSDPDWDGWTRLGQIDEALRDASDGLRRIRDIVADVKLFSRPLDDASGPLDVRRVIDSSARMAWNEVRHRARLVKDYRDVPRVRANESRFGQVVLNLIVNAAQAIPEGRVDTNEIRLVTRTRDDGWAIIEVADTGCGISTGNLDRIFDAFFTTKPVGVGTGLGLAICHRIVSDLGGTIEVDSVVRAGTTFRILLPRAENPPGAEPHASSPRMAGRRARVLLVDDDVAMARATQRALAGIHDVVAVNSAAEALAQIAAGARFDVILTDVMMPTVTGMELHQKLAMVAPDLARRVVFMTGGAFTSSAREYLDGVSNQCIDKPFDRARLLAVIDRLTREPS